MPKQSKQQVADKYVNIITSIVSVAAASEEGVASVSCEPGSITNTRIPQTGKAGKSIKVDIVGQSVIIGVSINAHFGYKLPELVARLQEKLKTEVEKATYYKVKTVNVSVAGVVFSE